MKQLLVIAIALTSVNAFATRARVTALAGSEHLLDTQSVYAKPAAIFKIDGDFVTVETGATGAAGAVPVPVATGYNGNAEGMIVRTMGDAKMALALGHQSKNASSWGLRAAAQTAALKADQQNPIEFTYGRKAGDMNWAGTFVYSNYNNKLAAAGALEKESSMGIRVGAYQGAWDATINLGLANTANVVNGNKFTGTMALSAVGGYKVDTLYYFGEFSTVGAKEETSAGAEAMKVADQSIKLGVANSHKKDGNEVFYSVSLIQGDNKVTVGAADVKTTALTLPIKVGLEVEASTWLTLRGSITQTTLINTTKKETSPVAGGTDYSFDNGANTTKVAAGAGLKFNKITVDGTLLTTTNQTLNATDLLGQVGMTYMF